MVFKSITWWPDAWHVFDGEARIGIVNRRVIRTKSGHRREIWFSHNRHFFSIKGEFPTRSLAAEAIPGGVIQHGSEAFC